MNYRKLMIFLFLIVVGATSLFISHGQQKEISKRTKDQKTQTAIEKQLAELPVVAFEEADRQAASDPSRAAKNSRHNSPVSDQGAKRPELTEDAEPTLLDLPPTHRQAEPAIPAASNLIIVGSIDDAKAYLSSDKTTVYSEVTITVEQVLKGEVRYGLVRDAKLTAERVGGVVRFSSGKILRRGALGKNIPSKGSRYLLFLNENQDGDGFSIVTGYKLQNNTVVPLDGIGGGDGGFPQFAAYKTYKDVPESTLIENVRKAVAAEGDAKNERPQ